jgi:arginyl-tRNA synthetase
VITLDLRDAIARAVSDLGHPADGAALDPVLRPGPAPGTYATSIAFGLSALLTQTTPPLVATQIATHLAKVAWIAEAAATGGGYVSVTVTPGALAGVAARITTAGPACARSEVLRGVTRQGPLPAELPAARTWEEARAALAAELTARLAEAAGATLVPARAKASAASDRNGQEEGGGRAQRRSRLDEGSGPVAGAAAMAGPDAVRFALARMVPGKPATVDGGRAARNSLDNPAYAVRYAHARAVSGVRWAAALGAPAQGEVALPRLPADPAGLALLDALSWLPERVAVAARRSRPDEFARYLEDLARAAIAAVPFVRPGDNERLAVASALAQAARTGLAAGLGLLGIAAPDRL